MKVYKFDDKYFTAVKRRFVQHRHSCDFNEVSEGMLLCVMSSSMTARLAVSLAVRMTLRAEG